MIRGGIADKLGNDYEAHWTLIEALRVLRGHADEIRIEPFNEDSKGFEFRINDQDSVEWHQCKRRRSSGTWTVGTLISEEVVANFLRKLGVPNAKCVFVSSDPAPTFKSLTDKARLVETVADFTASLNADEHAGNKQIEDIWGTDKDANFQRYKRCSVETVSEYSLKRQARAICELTFSADPALVIERLTAFLEGKITQTITTAGFRTAIDGLGIGWKAHLDETLDGRFQRATDEYLSSLLPPVAGELIPAEEIDQTVEAAIAGATKLLVVAGGAGSGKSVALARAIEAARAHGWPTLALRIDRFLAASRIEEVGTALVDRAESPVGILGNRHGLKETLLVIDQVDAVSEASGRSARMRDQLFQMIADSEFYPKMKVIIACRSYDLEHDSRLKQFISSPYTQTVTLKPLDWEVGVKSVLRPLGLADRTFTDREQRLLSVPINLQVFVDLYRLGEVVEGEISGSRLFDQLIEVRAREFRDAGLQWTPQEALGVIAQSMSNHQELTAPISVLSPYVGARDALSSASLITVAGGKIQFAHESFFDHVFSIHFIASGRTVRELLFSDEQRLFRRTQVRQIFARLRDETISRRYLVNLREVMEGDDVRYLVKDAIAHWLRSVDEPTQAELGVVSAWFVQGHPNRTLAHTIFSGPSWLPVLLKSGTIAGWVENGGDDKDVAMWLMQKFAVEHAELIEPFLRKWWSGDPDRLLELINWYARIFPEGPIGPLEPLYAELIAGYPREKLEGGKFEDSFDLGSWVHKNRSLGARVLGFWLSRWMAAFTESHPFGEYESDNNGYWINELVEHDPKGYLAATWEHFLSALERDREMLERGDIDYPTIRVPMTEHDGRPMWSLLRAIESVAKIDPDLVSAYLDRLPLIDKPALLIHLRAIAANGEALAGRLVPLASVDGIFDIGESSGEWLPFAQAAKAAFSFLSPADREFIEAVILAHRPELAWASKYCLRVKEGRGSLTNHDPEGYILHQLSLSGQDERGMLKTIGSEQLSDVARRRMAELDRKFKGAPLPEAFAIRGGWVSSPIDGEKATKMSDANWLSAFSAYSGEERHQYLPDSVIGGARELASVLQAITKEQPERFVSLLERMPLNCNALYPQAIVGAFFEIPANGPLATRAIQAARKWSDIDLGRTLSWTVRRHPEAARNPEVLTLVLRQAEFGDGTDPDVKVVPSSEDKPAMFREILRGRRDYETSGLNSDRGAAYDALASVLWEDAGIFDQVVELLDRRIEAEPLTSVRTMMLHTINSVARHDPMTGLQFLERVARRDLKALQCNNGHHILNWATYNSLFDANGVSGMLCACDDLSLRALGLLIRTGLAIGDDDQAQYFQEQFAEDALLRQAAAYRAAGNVTSDRVGDRATAWLLSLMDDEDPQVRREAARTSWDAILDGPTDRSALVLKHIQSRSFADESDWLMRSLEERIDRYPDLAFAAVMRIVELMDGWKGSERRGHWMTLHHLGRMLVALYRAVDGDSARETELLDLFDIYLARELGDMRIQISAYERH